MPFKDVTYENGFTERFYYDETSYDETLRMSRVNSVSKFPSVNSIINTRKSKKERGEYQDSDSPTRT